jgi:hypothetical protein
MKKIIILSDTDEPRYGLISHLKKLFPEFEIQIFPRRFENIEEDTITAARSLSLNTSGEAIT